MMPKYSKRFEREEKRTIEAINRLTQGDMPYAAAALTYILCERILIIYILKNRRNPNLIKRDFTKDSYESELSLHSWYRKSESDFYKYFLKNITLGDMSSIIIGFNRNLAEGRNRIVHSKMYIKNSEYERAADERHENNYKLLETAFEDLKYVLENYSSIQANIKSIYYKKIELLN